MKNRIFTFTGTGNSQVLGQQMAEILGDSAVAPVPGNENWQIADNGGADIQTIGIFFPVYAYRPPKMVMRFLKNLKRQQPKAYIYAVATCGGGPGNVISHVRNHVGRRNLNAGFVIQMPFNFLLFGSAGTREDQEERYSKAETQLRKIADTVNERGRYFEPPHNIRMTYLHPGILYTFLYAGIEKLDKGFRTDENCTGCGSCERICPVGNVRLEAGKPVWNHQCEQCWACLHWCPKQAIQSGKASENKLRYHHPAITRSQLNNPQPIKRTNGTEDRIGSSLRSS